MKIHHKPGFLSDTIPRNKEGEVKLKQAVKTLRWKNVPWYRKVFVYSTMWYLTVCHLVHMFFPNIAHTLTLNPVYIVTILGQLI